MAETKQNNLRFATKAVHAGQESEQVTGAVSVPIFQTSAYSNKKIGQNDGLVRLSVGIEDANDLLRDIKQALKKV